MYQNFKLKLIYYQFWRSEQPKRKPVDPYKLYGTHGYRTYSHARCQEVPMVDVNLQDVSYIFVNWIRWLPNNFKWFFKITGDWILHEYIASADGKPYPPHHPFLCPESMMKFSEVKDGKFNVSQVNF